MHSLSSSNTKAIVGALLSLCALQFSLTSQAEKAIYSGGINSGAWRQYSSVFECSVQYDVPFYGKAVFKTCAGESSKFVLRAETSRFVIK